MDYLNKTITHQGRKWLVTDKSLVTEAGSFGADEWLYKLEPVDGGAPLDMLDWELDDLTATVI